MFFVSRRPGSSTSGSGACPAAVSLHTLELINKVTRDDMHERTNTQNQLNYFKSYVRNKTCMRKLW